MPSRRSFLAGTVAGVVSLAGCSGDNTDRTTSDTVRRTTTNAPSTPTTESGGPSTQFSWSSTADRDPTADPVVTFPAPDRVVVEGALRYGSSTCDRIALDGATYADGTVDVRVASAPMASTPATCTDDLAAGGYRVEVTLAGGPPERVRVTEVPAVADARTHTATPD